MNSTEVRLRAEEQVGLRRHFLPDELLPEPVQPPKPAPLLSDEERRRLSRLEEHFRISSEALDKERAAEWRWKNAHEEACQEVWKENSKRKVLRFVREVLLEVASPPPLDEDAVKAYQAKVEQDHSRRVGAFLSKKKAWVTRSAVGYWRFIPERTMDLMLNLHESLERRRCYREQERDEDFSEEQHQLRKGSSWRFSLEIEEFVEEGERKVVVDPFLVLSVRSYKAEVRLYVDYWNETEFVPVYREV